MKVYHDPTLAHLDAKLIVWLLSVIAIAITLTILMPDFDEDQINRVRRPTRTTLRVVRGTRSINARRKAA